MKLGAYLESQPRGVAASIASELGVHPVMVSQWASGVKRPAVERCAAIEFATKREVRRWDLRPDDWHRIWPELIGAEGAPARKPTEEARDAA